MRVTTLAFVLLIFAAVGFSQEPANNAVSQPTAHQAVVSQAGVTQVSVGQAVPAPIPTVFVPLPTSIVASPRTSIQRTALPVSQPNEPRVVQPNVESCGCATH
ncbi:MAG TPA: hypothetical protein VGL89_00455 [Candidatus Koribacter sp.]|jgi:hypothetical protein